MENQTRSTLLTIPGAIIIAAAILAIAIIYVLRPAGSAKNSASSAADKIQQASTKQANQINLAPITAKDHILGNPNAPIKIVEYSDPSCPYCKVFNATMEKISDEYGPSGKVAWIYRHFPIDKPGTRPDGTALHPNAGHESQAIECAAVVGDNAKFWAYEKRLYEVTPSVTSETPKGLDQAQLPIIAKQIGLDVTKFNSCLSSGQTKDTVEADYTSGVNAGINGTPTSYVITANGETVPLVGYLPYANLKQAIDAILAP